jgi:hypothetical protein
MATAFDKQKAAADRRYQANPTKENLAARQELEGFARDAREEAKRLREQEILDSQHAKIETHTSQKDAM